MGACQGTKEHNLCGEICAHDGSSVRRPSSLPCLWQGKALVSECPLHAENPKN